MTNMLQKKRVVIGAIIAPLAPCVFFLLAPYVLGGNNPGEQYAFLTILFSLPISYVASLALGLPFLISIHKLNILNLPVLSIGAAILGMGVWYVFQQGVLAFMLDSHADFVVNDALWGAFLGACVGLTFGLIAGVPISQEK